jgi:hypothetical protein
MSRIQYWITDYEILTRNNTHFPLSNATSFTKFGSSMKKILLFYQEYMFETSYRTIQKPYITQGVSPKIIMTQKLEFVPQIP